MAKVIKTATVKKPRVKRSFREGQMVQWFMIEMFRPGAYQSVTYKGMIVKVRPTTIHCIDKDGNVWSVGKKEAYAM